MSDPTTPDRGLDREFRTACMPLVRFLFESYWRVSHAGLANVPATGGAILVGNHSGALPFDAAMLAYAIEIHGPGRVVRPLYARFLDGHPALSDVCRKLGGVTASYAAARELLAEGELVVIFPEGIDGVAKSFDERYRLGRFATSAARLSCEYRVPIVPFSVVGAEEIYPLVARSRSLGDLVGAPYVPITPFFPMLGPLGLLPLPTKWKISFGQRVHLYRESRFRGARRADFEAMAARLRRTVELRLQRELRGRRSIFFG